MLYNKNRECGNLVGSGNAVVSTTGETAWYELFGGGWNQMSNFAGICSALMSTTPKMLSIRANMSLLPCKLHKRRKNEA